MTTMPPADAVEAADELGMPILRVGAQSSLIEVERAIISLIVDKESQVGGGSSRSTSGCWRRWSTTPGIEALAAEVADVARRPTIVLDEYFRVQVTVPDDEATQQIGQEVGATLAAGDPGAGGQAGRAVLADVEERLARGAGRAAAIAGHAGPATWCWAAPATSPTWIGRWPSGRRVLGIELAKQRAVTEAQLRLRATSWTTCSPAAIRARRRCWPGRAGWATTSAARAAGGQPGGVADGSRARSGSRRPTWSGRSARLAPAPAARAAGPAGRGPAEICPADLRGGA